VLILFGAVPRRSKLERHVVGPCVQDVIRSCLCRISTWIVCKMGANESTEVNDQVDDERIRVRTEGSKSNITCCALLADGAHRMTRICVTYAPDSTPDARATSHPRIGRKCCALLVRATFAFKGCYFWTPLYKKDG
jgi:hypothetical protein